MRELILDLDGCLVNTDGSYTQAAIDAACELGARPRSVEDVFRLRSQGGFNDDYDVALEFLRQDGIICSRKVVIEVFQTWYLGPRWQQGEWTGYITSEPLLAQESFLDWVRTRRFSVFTGRPRDEAFYVLKRLGLVGALEHLVAMHDVANLKPHPEGLQQIVTVQDYQSPVSCGDTLDDLYAARAAGIEFAAVLPPAPSASEMMREAFIKENCQTVLTSVNDLPCHLETLATHKELR